MITLPGADQWSEDAVLGRIAFERNVASGAVALLTEIAAGHDYFNPEMVAESQPSDAIFAMAQAAEIAFATDHFNLGIEICREILFNESVAARTPMQLVFKSTIGALLGIQKIYLKPTGFSIREIGKEQQRIYDLRGFPATQSVRIFRSLIPAAAASGHPFETLGPVFLTGEASGPKCVERSSECP
jgi:hypothetical protein